MLKITVTIKENDYTIKISFEMKALATQFVRFPQRRIIKVCSNSFRPINLYKPRLLKD